eukprot:gb/GFBE01056732.1/.p1 GENE.gb/GFBE01056732.1/~~gb/GFBE01056732.1/.p1  ORF type:complete len:362 (+),score=106.54 gb/GFBE01056732.1/:1-1086(+)
MLPCFVWFQGRRTKGTHRIMGASVASLATVQDDSCQEQGKTATTLTGSSIANMILGIDTQCFCNSKTCEMKKKGCVEACDGQTTCSSTMASDLPSAYPAAGTDLGDKTMSTSVGSGSADEGSWGASEGTAEWPSIEDLIQNAVEVDEAQADLLRAEAELQNFTRNLMRHGVPVMARFENEEAFKPYFAACTFNMQRFCLLEGGSSLERHKFNYSLTDKVTIHVVEAEEEEVVPVHTLEYPPDRVEQAPPTGFLEDKIVRLTFGDSQAVDLQVQDEKALQHFVLSLSMIADRAAEEAAATASATAAATAAAAAAAAQALPEQKEEQECAGEARELAEGTVQIQTEGTVQYIPEGTVHILPAA